MKRLLPILVMALLSLSACDSGTLVSPLEPEVGEPSFAKVELAEFLVDDPCSDSNCLYPVVTMTRLKGAPAIKVVRFESGGLEGAVLGVQVSDPKTTTVKAWLNGVTVLLPSAIPHSGENPLRLNIPLDPLETENVLTVRLSAKPGNWAAFWVEGEVVAPTKPEDPAPSVVFDVTEAVAAPTDDMNSACVAEFGADFGVADWNEVVAAVAGGTLKEQILSSGTAFVLQDGVGTFIDFVSGLQHYMLSATVSTGTTYGTIGTDFWLNASPGSQPVLCISTSEGSS